MDAQKEAPSWISEATGALFSSIHSAKNRMGVFAERLDELCADVFSNVEEVPELDIEPIRAPRYVPHSILHANGDVTEVIGMNSLPIELVHRIFLQVKPTVAELVLLSSVNRTWHCLTRDRQIWNEMYARYQRQWAFLECPKREEVKDNHSSEDIQPVVTGARPNWFTPKTLFFNDITVAMFAAIDEYRAQVYPNYDGEANEGIESIEMNHRLWMRHFVQQFKWNHLLRSEKIEVSKPSTFMKKLRALPPLWTVPVFGPGVGKAQRAVYDLVGQVAPDVVSMHDGVRGIGTGLGFCYDGVIFKMAGIHRPPDPFHTILVQDQAWRSLFQNAAFCIYAISPKLSLAATKDDLHAFLQLNFSHQPDQTTTPRPLLILSFFPELSAFDVAHSLDLFNLPKERIWAVKRVENRVADLLFAFRWAKETVRSIPKP